MEKYVVTGTNQAFQVLGWLRERGGIQLWKSIDLGDPGKTWTTPVNSINGTPNQNKPSWQSSNTPYRTITSVDEVDVVMPKEVKRFRVGVEYGYGLSLRVTTGGSNRIRKAVAKASEQHGCEAWHTFDYETQEAVILVEGSRIPMSEWVQKQGV